jgi:hypothetical protein
MKRKLRTCNLRRETLVPLENPEWLPVLGGRPPIQPFPSAALTYCGCL